MEIVHRQADGDSADGQQFAWDPSMEAGLMESINAETNADTEPGHVHGPDREHSRQVEPTPDMAELESNLIEVTHALFELYGDAGPTPQQEKEFIRKWLLGKGRSQEEIDAILTE